MQLPFTEHPHCIITALVLYICALLETVICRYCFQKWRNPPNGSHTPVRGRTLNAAGAQVGLPGQCFLRGCVVGASRTQAGREDGKEDLDQVYMLPEKQCSEPMVLPLVRSYSRKTDAVLLPSSLPPPRRAGVLSWAREKGDDNNKG